jgi:hypothetical protein
LSKIRILTNVWFFEDPQRRYFIRIEEDEKGLSTGWFGEYLG